MSEQTSRWHRVFERQLDAPRGDSWTCKAIVFRSPWRWRWLPIIRRSEIAIRGFPGFVRSSC